MCKIPQRDYLYKHINEVLVAQTSVHDDYQQWLAAGNRPAEMIYLGHRLDPFTDLRMDGVAIGRDDNSYFFYRQLGSGTRLNQVNHLSYRMSMTIYNIFDYNPQDTITIGLINTSQS